MNEEMTVAQLRELLKQGDNKAKQLVNDLISELPNQVTTWIDKYEAKICNDDYLTPEEFEEFWEWFSSGEWNLYDTADEINSALEHWSTFR